MENALVRRIRIATPLTAFENTLGVISGIMGLSLARYLAKVRAATLDAPGAPVEFEAPREPRRKAQTRVLAAEQAEAVAIRRRLANELPTAKRAAAAIRATYTKLQGEAPVFGSISFWLGFAAVLLVSDAAYNFLTISDAVGLDTAAGLRQASGLVVALVVLTTLLATTATVWCGVRIADRRVPLRRIGGWALLLFIAAVLAALRGSAAADASSAFAIFGFAMTIAAGWASAEAHARVSDFLDRRSAFFGKLKSKQQELEAAEQEVAGLEAGLQVGAERRRTLARESDALEERPAAPVRRGAAAAENEERRRLLKARLAAARYAYAFGARLAGRSVPRLPGGRSDA